MRPMNNYYMQLLAIRKARRFRFFAVLSYVLTAILVIAGIGNGDIFGSILSNIMIFGGVGILLGQGARSAEADARRYAEFNPTTAYPAEMQAQMPHMQYYGTSSREYRRYLRNLQRYGMTDSRAYGQQPNRTNNQPQAQQPVQQPIQPKPPTRALIEYFDHDLSVLQQGHAFAREINKANELIPDEVISQNLNVICEHVNDIFIQASKNPDTERQIRKFGNIYLPQTLKLCNLYIDLQSKRVETKTVKELKEQIAKSIANARCAFTNFNENLMQQASIDIEAEVKTFENILTIDGLLGRHELVMPEVSREKEKA